MKLYNFNKLNLILLSVLFVIVFFIFINYIYLAITNLLYPYDLQYDEGGFFTYSLFLYRGNFSSLYTSIGEKTPFTDYNPPVFYLISAILFIFFGESIVAGRLLSIISSFGVSFIIYKIIKKNTKSRALPIISSLLYFSSFIIFYWAPIMRSDNLALLFSLIGIYLIMDYKKNRNLYLASLFFILSVFTRQTYLMAIFASFIYLFFKDRKVSFKFIFLVTIPAFVILLLLTIFTNGYFLTNIILQASLMGNPNALTHIFLIFRLYFILFALSLVFIYYNRKSLFGIYFLLSLIFSLIQVFKFGGFVQYFIEPTAIVLIIIPILYEKIKNKIFPTLILIFLILYVSLMVFDNNNLVLTISEPQKYAAIKNLETDEKLYSYIKNASGNVLSDHGYLLFLANKNLTPNVFELYEVERSGLISEQEIYDYIKNNNITLIAYRSTNIENLSKFNEFINSNYLLIDKLQYYDYKGIDTWKVYSRIS